MLIGHSTGAATVEVGAVGWDVFYGEPTIRIARPARTAEQALVGFVLPRDTGPIVPIVELRAAVSSRVDVTAAVGAVAPLDATVGAAVTLDLLR